MRTYLLNISSPDGKLFSGQVTSLIVRGVEGEFCVLADHIPFVTSVVDGKCIIELEDGTVKEGHTEGGLITVGKGEVTYLTAGVSFE